MPRRVALAAKNISSYRLRSFILKKKRAQDIAIRAHEALGCRGMSRTDLLWSGDRMVALEVNTIPGMTQNSLLPKAARAAGIDFGDLLARFVDWALEDARRRRR